MWRPPPRLLEMVIELGVQGTFSECLLRGATVRRLRETCGGSSADFQEPSRPSAAKSHTASAVVYARACADTRVAAALMLAVKHLRCSCDCATRFCYFSGLGIRMGVADAMTLDCSTSERLAQDVLGLLTSAARARLRLDWRGVIEGLAAALDLYEQYPTEVHGSRSEMRKLLAFIRHAGSVHRKLDHPDHRLQELESRAEALRKPLH